jgi:DNA modification methylase
VLIDEDNRLIAGHGRREAARRLGHETIPAIRLRHLSEAQKRALVLADNKIAANAGWDIELLAQELVFLCEAEFDVDVTVTGFAPAEIDIVIEEARGKAADDRADSVPPVPEDGTTCVRRSDLWQLGTHRLLCGDATDRDDVHRLMDNGKAQLIFADPPYNVPIDGHVCGSGGIRHREFAMASGEMSAATFTVFLESAFRNLVAASTDGSIHFICMDWRHMYDLLSAARDVYSEQKNLCVWNKNNGGMGSLYRSKHELVFVFKNGSSSHINNVELGRHGRYRTNVWDYAGINTFGAERMADLAMHPTVKPVAMVADAILDCSRRGHVVLDSFAGSGTTIIAAERTGRRARALELDPRYVETAIRRWEQYTGETAIHTGTGLALEAMRDRRSPPADSDHDTPLQSPATGSVTPIAEITHGV